jgi:hypothetical protein
VVLARRLEPEWLDELPGDDARARRARRDLARINTLLGQGRLMARLIRENYGGGAPRTLLELGAGDGTFNLHVAQRLAKHWPKVHVLLLDQQGIVSDITRRGYAAIGWKVDTVTADVYDYVQRAESRAMDVVCANLFVHHIPPERMGWFLERIASICRLFVCCEPRRSKSAIELSRLSWMIGCGEVFIHDAIVSLRAGFTDNELSALWPPGQGWRLQERESGLFTHCFAARRIDGA